MSTTLPSRPATLALIGALLFGAGHGAIYYGLLNDDAMISLRVVANFGAGHGWVYNPGDLLETSVHPLWIWLLSLLQALGCQPDRAAALLSYTGLLAALTSTAWLGWRLLGSTLAWVPVWLVAATPTLCAHAGTGIETTWHIALLTLALGRTALDPPVGWKGLVGPALLGLAVWLRLEAFALAAAALVLRSLLLSTAERRLGDLLRQGTVLVAMAGAISLWRLAYYGDLLPNVVHAKIRPGFDPGVYAAGIHYVERWLHWDLGYAVAGGGLLLALGAGRRAAFLALTVGVGLLGVVGMGGDFMPYNRFCSHLLPLTVLAVVAGWNRMAAALDAAADRRHRVGAIMAAAALLLGLQPLGQVVSQGNLLRRNQANEEFRAEVGRWLRKRAKEEEGPLTVALGPAGHMAYAAGPRVEVIDMLGLCDRHTARRGGWDPQLPPGHQRGDGEYVLGRRPQLIIFGAVTPGDPFQQDRFPKHLQELREKGIDYWLPRWGRDLALAERQILASPSFWRHYSPCSVTLPSGRRFNCLARRDRDG